LLVQWAQQTRKEVSMTSKLLAFLAGAILLGLTLAVGHRASAMDQQFQYQKLKWSQPTPGNTFKAPSAPHPIPNAGGRSRR